MEKTPFEKLATQMDEPNIISSKDIVASSKKLTHKIFENMNKEYLGDSVYIEVDESGSIVLTTENGYGPSNTIVMEPKVVAAFKKYLKKADDVEMANDPYDRPLP